MFQTCLKSVLKSLSTKIIPKFKIYVSNSFGQKYLIYTNVGLSITLSGLGDVIEQNLEMCFDEKQVLSWTRTRNMSLCGMFVGIFCHHWYNFLDRRLPGYTISIVLKKIFIDQIICSPISVGAIFVTTGVLEGKTVVEFYTEVKQKAWKLYLAEWVVWPPAQFVNFYFLPTKYRVLYDNTISLGYDVFTSYVKHSEVKS